MTEPVLDALDLCRSEILRRLDALTPADWSRPTPCGDWTVRQLVNHIVSHEHRFADNFTTNSFEYYLTSREDDFLGDDPHAAWAAGVAAFDAAIAGLDSLNQVIQWRVPRPARDLVAFRVVEGLVHTWDLSRAIGFDEQLDDGSALLVTPVFEDLIENPDLAAFFTPPAAPPPADTSPQHRLLLLAGRNP